MKKWTKVLSAFVVATVMSTGLAAMAGCSGCDDEHEHTYKTEWSKSKDGHWKESDCGHDPTGLEPHVDEITNGTDLKVPDHLCDICGYDLSEPAPEQITVTFVVGTGVTAPAQQKIDKGGKATKPATDPVKTDNTFDGWFSDEQCTKPFDFNSALSADTKIYAKFTPNTEVPPVGKVTVTFVTGTGASTVDAQSIDKGGKATRPATDPTKDGHTFDNWYSDEECTTLFDFDTVINESTSIYAKFTPNGEVPPVTKVTVTFVTGTGASTVEAQSIDKGGKATRPATDPTKDGHSFDNWYSDEECTHVFDFDTAINESTSIYAKFTPNGEVPPVTNHLYEISAAKFEGEKLSKYSESTQYGLYSDMENFTKGEKGFTQSFVKVLGSGETDGAYVSFARLKGNIEGSFEFSASKMGSKWDIVRFRSNGSDVFCVRTSDDSKNLSFVKKLNGGTPEATELTVKPAADTTYKVEYKLTKGDDGKYSLTLKIAGETFVNDLALGVKSLDCIYIPCSNAKSANDIRLITIDNVIIDAEVMTVDDYKADSLEKLNAEKAKYILEDSADGEIKATHSINKTLVTAAYNDGVEAIGAASTIEEVSAAYANAIATLKAILSDAQVVAARTAAIAEIDTTFPAANYTYDFEEDNADAIYNNKATFETEIAAIKAQINAATTQAALDAILEAATISVENNSVQLTAKRTAAKTALESYKEDKIAEIETTHATQFGNIADIKTDTAEAIDEAATIQKVSELLADAQTQIDSELQSTTETFEQTMARYQGMLEAEGTSAKGEETDTAKLAAVDNAVTAGKTALNSATADNIGEIFNAEKAKVHAAIPKIDAKATLLTSANAAKTEIHGESAAATTATNAVDAAVTAGNSAIDSAADSDAVAAELTKAQTAVTTAINVLKATEFAVKVMVNGSDISNGIKVKYGSALTIDESKLTLTEEQMIDKYFGSDDQELDKTVIYYDEVTITATIKKAHILTSTEKLNYAPLIEFANSNNIATDKPLPAEAFTGDNKFLTLGSGEVRYRTDKDVEKNFLQVTGEIFKVQFKGTGTLVISGRGTGKSANAAISVIHSDGTTCALVGSAPSGVTAYDDNVYSIASSSHVKITFTIPKAGTYSIVVLRNGENDPVKEAGVKSESTFGMARISAIEVVDNYKVPCDVTVTFGSTVEKYYHDEEIPVPPDPKTGNGEFLGWYDGSDVKFVAGKLAAGEYTFTAKYEYTAHIQYNNGSKDIDLYLNVANGAALAAKLDKLDVREGDGGVMLEHTGWSKTDGGEKITDFSEFIGAKNNSDTHILYPVFEESTKIFVSEITVTAADGKTTVEAGKTLQLTATVTPDNATDKSVTWSIPADKQDIATVDASTGLVTAKKEGTVTVTATAADGSGVTGTIDITVTAPAFSDWKLDFANNKVGTAGQLSNDATLNDVMTVDSVGYKTQISSGYLSANSKNSKNPIISFKVEAAATFTITHNGSQPTRTFVIKDSTGKVIKDKDGNETGQMSTAVKTYELSEGTYTIEFLGGEHKITEMSLTYKKS